MVANKALVSLSLTCLTHRWLRLPGVLFVGLLFGATGFSQEPCLEWDSSFEGNGVEWIARAMAVFDDGSEPALYFGGHFDAAGGTAVSHIAKWDGANWASLPGMNSDVLALAVFDDGSGPALYAGGSFGTAGGVSASRIAKWDGSSWSALGTGITGFAGGPGYHVYALEVFDDGSGPALFVGGRFLNAGGVPALNIAKWDGSNWSALGTGVAEFGGEVDALEVFDDGLGPALYAGGEFDDAGGVTVNSIAKWDGTTWSALGSGMNNDVRALTVFDAGSGPALYAGGDFTSAGGMSANRVAKWDGSTWSALDTGLTGIPMGPMIRVYALSVFDDGSGPALCAGGDFSDAGGVAVSNIAQWDGSGWSSLGGGMSSWVRAFHSFDDGSGPTLYAGGSFLQAEGKVVNATARWTGSEWSELGGNGLNERTDALTEFDDGSGSALYAGGWFGLAGGTWGSAGTTAVDHIARWNGASWSPVGSGLSSKVLDLAVFDDGTGPALYAGGGFGSAGGVEVLRVAKWDGSSWSPLGIGISGTNVDVRALTVFDDGSGPALYAGGTFVIAGGESANRIAKWDGSSWSALGTGLTGSVSQVEALTVFDDGSGPALYAGGVFSNAGGVSALNIAKWNGSSWSAVGSGTNGIVRALIAFEDDSGSKLYAGGSFTIAGGASAMNVASWDGSSWSPVGSGMDGEVRAFAGFDDGSGPALFAGGAFTTAGGASAARIARWDGSAWTALGNGMNDEVYSLAPFDDGAGADLFAGGDFTSAGGHPSAYIAKWGCAPLAPTTYCTAGTSASGCQALLSATGTPSASAASGFTLQASTVEGQKDGLFFFGTNGQQANPWGNGTSYQCVVPPVVRTPTMAGVGTIALCDGTFALDLNALWCPTCPKPGKNPGAGATVKAQLWYRDPGSTSNQTTSLSDAVEFGVGL